MNTKQAEVLYQKAASLLTGKRYGTIVEVADEEARKYYESNGDMISESGEIIPLDTVRSAVDNEIRQLRYAEMIEERAESLKVEADEEQLFAFIVNHI